MDLGSNYSQLFPARRGLLPPLPRSASLPIRAPVTSEDYASDESSYAGSFGSGQEEEEGFDSEEERRPVVGVSSGKGPALRPGGALVSNVAMPRARLSLDDEEFGESFDDESFEEEEGEDGVEEGFGVETDEKDGFLEDERVEGGDGLSGSVEVEGEQRPGGSGGGVVEGEGVGCDGDFGEAGGEVVKVSSEGSVHPLDEEVAESAGDVLEEGAVIGVREGEDEPDMVEEAEASSTESAVESAGGMPLGGVDGVCQEIGVKAAGRREHTEESLSNPTDSMASNATAVVVKAALDLAGATQLGVGVVGSSKEAGVVAVGDEKHEEEGDSESIGSIIGDAIEAQELGSFEPGSLDWSSSVESEVTSVSNAEIIDGLGPVNLGNGGDEPLREREHASCDLEEISSELWGLKRRNSSDCDDDELEISSLVEYFDAPAASVSNQGDNGAERCDGRREVLDLNEDGHKFEADVLASEHSQKVGILESPPSSQYAMKDLVDVSSTRRLTGNLGDISYFEERMTDSKEEVELDIEGEVGGNELSDMAALAAILNTATSASSVGVEGADGINEESKLHGKIEQMRVKFLRLLHRLDRSPQETVATQVLNRLSLAEGLNQSHRRNCASSMDNARQKALQLEANGKSDLDCSCNILVLGKSGVGKSATINSIFGERVSATDAFAPATKCVKEIVGVVNGVKISFIDTPGLMNSVTWNKKVLFSIRKHIKRYPPDVVLYVDRLDSLTWDFNDLPLLRLISSVLGTSIWSNAIAVLTHGSYAPHDSPNGTSSCYNMFVAKRCHVVQSFLQLASGSMHGTNPVVLVENHPSCRRDEDGQMVLPNGEVWRSHLLLLCSSLKVLSEVDSILKLQDPSTRSPFGFCIRFPPLPYLLSNLLHCIWHTKPPTDQSGGSGYSKIALDEPDCLVDGKEDEPDQLPPFRPLKQSEIVMLNNKQRKAYFNEYDYRIRLLQKKQLEKELKEMKETKKAEDGGCSNSKYGDRRDDYDRESALEPNPQLLVRPVLDKHVWDHDCGYCGFRLEESLLLARRFPAAFVVQITNDKKECSIHLDPSALAIDGEHMSTLACFDFQTIRKHLVYILPGETQFKSSNQNKITKGMSLTFLGEDIVSELKVEHRACVGRTNILACVGTISGQSEFAYGANLEAQLRRKDRPLELDVFSLGLSSLEWRGGLAIGANLQFQYLIGRNSRMAVCFGLNNKSKGLISVKASTSEQLQIALLGILPIAISFFKIFWPTQ